MKSIFHNAILTKFTMEGPWNRSWNFKLERKIIGFDHCRKLLNGAIYDKNGHLIHESIRKGGIFGDQVISIAPIIVDPNTETFESIEGNSAYLGNLYSHYGHFITEGLSRFYNFKELNKFDHILFNPYIFDYPNTQLQSFHKFFFDELGLDSSKIKILSNSARLERVTVFKQLWTINDSVDPEISKLYEYLRFLDPKITISEGRFFCSRKSSDRISNSRKIEELFSTMDFEVIFPEDLSLEKQLAIYKGDNLIVSTSGSTVHNILFGREGSRFVEIGDKRTPKSPHIMQQLANSLSIANYQFLPFHSDDNENWNLAELEKLVKAL